MPLGVDTRLSTWPATAMVSASSSLWLGRSGPSKVGLSGALRARDVDRPTAEDLAEAERTVVIVRREEPAARDSGRDAARRAASGDAPARRPRRRRPSGSEV